MVSREFAGDVRFWRCSPENGFRDDAQEWRNCNVPVGRLIITAPDSRKLPRRIGENRRESGNPANSPALSAATAPSAAAAPSGTGKRYWACRVMQTIAFMSAFRVGARGSWVSAIVNSVNTKKV
ncbi:hypothetical protein BTHE_2005 [Bifidobacterium thermophilum]|nr:hypothetical protein BTHE_2005 [Bifidobacterium thermophilum]